MVWLLGLIWAVAGPRPVLAEEDAHEDPNEATFETFTLFPWEDSGGMVVERREFSGLINNYFPEAKVKWNPESGLLRIEAEGHRIDALLRTPALIVDGKLRKADRPLMKRRGRIVIPLENVLEIFKVLGIDYLPVQADSADQSAQDSPSPALEEQLEPQMPTVPGVPSTIFDRPPPSEMEIGPADLLAEVGGEDLQPFDEYLLDSAPTSDSVFLEQGTPEHALGFPIESAPTAPTPLPGHEFAMEAPAGTQSSAPVPGGGPTVPRVVLTSQTDPVNATNLASAGAMSLLPPSTLADRISLTWEQLADLDHRYPPRRVTVVCDQPLKAVGELLRGKLAITGSLDVALVTPATPRRDQGTLLNEVIAGGPQLLVDLIALPVSEGIDPAEQSYMVWVAHEALWPQDRQRARTARDPPAPYHRHQFQALALGSLLRNELGRQFPDQTVHYDLAPAYLLRRVDCPSAGLIVPIGRDEDPPLNAERAEMLAKAVYAALIEYIRQMERVRF